jgi:hypothetical protein
VNKPVLFSDEGWRRLQGREAELFPALVRPRVRAVLWATVLALGAGLACLAIVLAGNFK